MALAEEYLLDQVASGDCSQATLTSLATMGFDPGLSYASYRVYAERTLASMPRPNLTLDENVKMIAGIKNRLAEFQAQVPSDAMDDANQTVAYWQQTSCRLESRRYGGTEITCKGGLHPVFNSSSCL